MVQVRLLGDRYELSDILGRGGMAEVRMGRDVRLGRTVAVKTLRSDLALDSTFQARFRREAQSAASLNHPSIVAVYDTGEDYSGSVPVPYIVMEYVEGSTLRELLNSGHKLLPERALEITASVLDALDYSHRMGIIHRDIKPGNVMLTRTGSVKVMDFGIARAVADASATVTATAAVIGTAQYLSPEQAKGEKVDPRSDLYSTGCLLYELLTGQPPFTGDSPVSVAYQHVRENPIPPSQLNPNVTPAMDAIVMKALAKNVENRYQTAAEMRDDIQRCLEGRPVTAPPVLADMPTQRLRGQQTIAATSVLGPAPETRVAPPPPPSRRGMWYALLAVAVIAFLILGALVGRTIFGTSASNVVVPNLEGLTRSAAEQQLSAKGLVLGDVTERFSDTVEAGRVIEQDPARDAQVPEGTAVNVVISQGQNRIQVPDVVGVSLDEARRMLADAQLELGRTTRRNSNQPEGEVIDSSPNAGSQVTPGTQVDLVVSNGVREITVPDVRNRQRADAEAILRQAGFRVAVVRQEEGSVPEGTVLSQTPDPGTRAREGDRVSIVVAQAPSTPAPQPTPTPTDTPTVTPTNTGSGQGGGQGSGQGSGQGGGQGGGGGVPGAGGGG
jgi:beta-lactam-binding protein with PASTA domain/predicted Ser/Thr protein kinase